MGHGGCYVAAVLPRSLTTSEGVEKMTILDDYKSKREHLKQMGGAKAVEAQHKAGKMTARERIDYLFDPGTFTEIGLYVSHRQTAFGMDTKELPADGVITGYGRVDGRLVVVAAEDYTTMAGTFGEYHGKKFSQAIDFAKEKGLPFIGMNDSGGARLQEGMDTLECYGWLFTSQILASGIVPQIALLMGPCLGGQAYHPIMQDFLIQCKKTGFMGIAGPAFVKTQTGEEIDLETLCGHRAQAGKAGQTHFVADDDKGQSLFFFFFEQFGQSGNLRGREARKHLVEQKQLRVCCDGSGQFESSQISHGQLIRMGRQLALVESDAPADFFFPGDFRHSSSLRAVFHPA